MKLRYFLYGIFGLSLLFAGIILYLRFMPNNTDDSGSVPDLLVDDRGKTVSGKSGKLGIAYAGDMVGSLTPCNCTDPPSGGVARRATAISDFRKQRQDVPILVADTGNNTKQTDDLEDPKNRGIVEALEALGDDVINANLGDLLKLEPLAQAGRISKDGKANYVATMLERDSSSAFSTKPFLVKSLRSATGNAEAKVGVLAVAAIPPGIASTTKALTIDEALQKYLPQVDSQSDIVILLTRVKEGELKRIAQAFPAVDVIINGDSTGEGKEHPKIGNTVIVESSRQALALGMLDLEWDSDGHITKYKNQTMPLLPALSDSPELAQVVTKIQKDVFTYSESEAKKTPTTTAKSLYGGPKSCKPCHENAYSIWAKSQHARSMETLKAKFSQYNDDCLLCHATGAMPLLKNKGGFINIVQTPQLAFVGCESCHGTSMKHTKSPKTQKTGLGIGIKPSEKTCKRCHDKTNSPNFDYKIYWSKIAHK
jgi:hypothetical protein